MNPSRKTQSGEDLKMQSITNVVAQLQTVQSELELELQLSQIKVWNKVYFLSNLYNLGLQGRRHTGQTKRGHYLRLPHLRWVKG